MEYYLTRSLFPAAMLLDHERLIVGCKRTIEFLQNHSLLEADETYNGYKPYRTYNGFSYQGGFSDHLPVYVDLIFEVA